MLHIKPFQLHLLRVMYLHVKANGDSWGLKS